MDARGELAKKYQMVSGPLDERGLRLCLGADALSLGRGGASIVARAAGVSRTTVHAGMAGLREDRAADVGGMAGGRARFRKPGGGRKSLKDKDEKLMSDVDQLVDPITRGDPMVPL